MAFDSSKIAPSSVSLTSTNVPVSWNYKNTADTVAAIKASGYFNTWTTQLSQYDWLYVRGSDGSDLVQVTSATGAATVTVAPFIDAGDIADGSVTTVKLADLAVTAAKIANDTITAAQLATGAVLADELATDAVETVKIKDANVTLAKLAAGITPSHVVKFAAEFTTVGGGAAEAISVPGALATDIAFVQLKTPGAAPKTVDAAAVTLDTLTVTFSGDPSNDHVIYYQILRAAS